MICLGRFRRRPLAKQRPSTWWASASRPRRRPNRPSPAWRRWPRQKRRGRSRGLPGSLLQETRCGCLLAQVEPADWQAQKELRGSLWWTECSTVVALTAWALMQGCPTGVECTVALCCWVKATAYAGRRLPVRNTLAHSPSLVDAQHPYDTHLNSSNKVLVPRLLLLLPEQRPERHPRHLDHLQAAHALRQGAAGTLAEEACRS